MVHKRRREFPRTVSNNHSDDPVIREKITAYINESLKQFEKKNTDQLLKAISENDLEKILQIFLE